MSWLVQGRAGEVELTKGQELNAGFGDETGGFSHFVGFTLEYGGGGSDGSQLWLLNGLTVR